MNREYQKWFSPALDKDMELLVFGHAGRQVLFFPTRTAHFYDYEDWKIIDALKDKIEAGLLQVFCVDSIDAESFYATIPPPDKIRRHLQYEQYIIHEVLTLISRKYAPPPPSGDVPPIAPSSHTHAHIHTHAHTRRTGLTVAGCSLGGYHAMNIALKYPQYFDRVLGMSARYDLSLSTESFPDLFNGYFDENIYYNMPSMYLPNLADESMLEPIRKLDITLVVGREDPFYENNLHFSAALTAKHIPHHLYVWEEEAHRPRYWRAMVQQYL
ncbi:MAG: alpha/beta hydrolase-fold protein [Puia sp.]|nr:alpha/beta hydrolase-fold protein [Puia sp.]